MHSMAERLSEQIVVRLTPSEAKTLKETAEAEQRSLGSFVRYLIELGRKSRSGNGVPYLAEPSADAPQDFHYTEMPVCGLAAAGVGRQPVLVDLDEMARVINPLARKAQKGGWKVIRIVGNSMETTFYDGDLVLMEPSSENRRVKPRDIIYCLLNGEPQVKEWRESKGRASLMPHNLEEHSPIPITESDELVLLGIVHDMVGRENVRGKR